MKWNLFLASVLFIGAIFCREIHAKKNDTFIISPLVTQIDSTFTPLCSRLPALTFYIQSVTDESSSRDSSGIVGETRVRRNRMLPIICKPVPSAAVRQSLQAVFSGCGKAANSVQDAGVLISVAIVEFTLKETSKKFTQTMDASIVLKVSLSSSSEAIRPKQFTVSIGSSYTTLDTSKHAERILRQAVIDALREILKNCT